MEEFNASAGTPAGPGDRAASASVALDAGRLGGVLLQLQRERFDGVLHVACSGQAASIGFREGTPVTFEDSTPGHMLADQFVERGQLTREQCNKVLARMTDALVDDEAVAFCEHAVQLGFLTEEEAKVELSSRIRARMIQLFGWQGCEFSLMPGVAALMDRPEFPQSVGAILYMGVRTFYDEDLLISCHPDLSQVYVRLTAQPATIVEFFGLDDEELHLLRRIQPDDPASLLVETRKVERMHLLALLLLLRMAHFCEVFNHPQPRATSPRMPHARAAHGRAPTGPIRDEGSAARRAPGRAPTGPVRDEGSAARRPPGPPRLPREEGSVARRFDLSRDEGSNARRFDLPREEGSVARGFDLPREDRSGARRPGEATGPLSREDRSAGSRAGQLPREENSGSKAGQLPREDRSAGSRAGQLPREDRSGGSRAGQLPRDENSGSRVGQLPRDERSGGSRAGQLSREENSGSRAGQLPREENSGSRAGQLPREENSGSRAGQLPREEYSGSRAGQLPREDRSGGSRAGQLPRDENSASRAGQLPREDRSGGSRAGQFPRDENSGSRARQLPRDENSGSRAGQLPRDEGSVARGFDLPRDEGSAARGFDLPRDERSGARRPAGATDERSASRSGQLAREERVSDSRAGELPRNERASGRRADEPPQGDRQPPPEQDEEHSFAGIADALPRADDSTHEPAEEEYSFAGVADEPQRAQRPAARRPDPQPEQRSVARMASTPPEPDPVQGARVPPAAASAAQALHTPPPPEPHAARSPLRDPPAPGRSARPTVDATQEALLEAAARTARMRRSLPARRNSKQADPPPAAEGGNPASKLPDPSTTYTNAYASKSGSFDPSKSGSFDPSKSGSFDPSKSGSFEPSKTGPTQEYAKAHLKELIARRKQTANAPESTASSNQRDPARELREARSLLHAQQFARAEKALSGLVELEPTNELYKTYHLWARWRTQPEAAESLLNELQELAKKLVSDSEHGAFAAYVLGHVFFHQKRDDLAERFFKRAHAADRGNKDAERHLMILERRKHSAADGGAGANRKLFGIQLPNKPKP